MGKGKGKPSDWAAKIPSMLIFIEFRNVRAGRVRYFLKQVMFKLPGLYKIISKYTQHTRLNSFKKIHARYDHFF
jgi:ribosomal protein L16/L10AE